MTDYQPPEPAEVRAILSALGLTGGQAAALIGLSGSRQIRKYTGGDEPRAMPFSSLYALVHRASGRQIAPDTWRVALQDWLIPDKLG